MSENNKKRSLKEENEDKILRIKIETEHQEIIIKNLNILYIDIKQHEIQKFI